MDGEPQPPPGGRGGHLLRRPRRGLRAAHRRLGPTARFLASVGARPATRKYASLSLSVYLNPLSIVLIADGIDQMLAKMNPRKAG